MIAGASERWMAKYQQTTKMQFGLQVVLTYETFRLNHVVVTNPIAVERRTQT